VRASYRAEELYRGPYLKIAPDIVFLTHDAYMADSALEQGIVSPAPADALARYSGLHTMDGILIAYGPGVRPGYAGEGLGIVDVAPTVLYALDQAIPADMDGRARTDLFRDTTRAVRLGEELGHATGRAGPVSAADEEQMRDKLRGLGYI